MSKIQIKDESRSKITNANGETKSLPVSAPGGGGGGARNATFIDEFSTFRYLKEFRVEQCTSFLQHKCNQHKPFVCFNWHFDNQRRRRPVRRRDGTFNYSADNYCTKYDETKGKCPDGDE